MTTHAIRTFEEHRQHVERLRDLFATATRELLSELIEHPDDVEDTLREIMSDAGGLPKPMIHELGELHAERLDDDGKPVQPTDVELSNRRNTLARTVLFDWFMPKVGRSQSGVAFGFDYRLQRALKGQVTGLAFEKA